MRPPSHKSKSVYNNNLGYSILYTRKGEEILIDNEDYSYVLSKAPYYITNRNLVCRSRRRSDRQPYMRVTLVQLSRELFGYPPRNYYVHHKNGNKLDCRRSNLILRIANLSTEVMCRQTAQPFPEWDSSMWEEYIEA